jgi:cation diffusion facilitator family transporter
MDGTEHSDGHERGYERGHSHGGDTHGHPYGHGDPRGSGTEPGHDDGHERTHEDGHAHVEGHPHGHEHPHGPAPRRGLPHRLRHLITPHSHEAAAKVDAAMEASAEGMRTLWLSLAVLGATTVVQAVVVALSGSVALLGDTIHNAADALTAVPLGIAFVLGRKAANRRYTYGYGRAEDLAGVVIVATIAASSALAGYEAVDRLLHPRDVSHFAGNEWVARLRLRTGRRIGSAALVADGLHARTDGFTSLAVLLGAGGVALGWRAADPVVGLLITAAILLVLKEAAREVYRRLMDCVDPHLVDTAEAALRSVPGVLDVGHVRMRWIGHALRAEADIVVDPAHTVVEAHLLAVHAEHALIHAVPRLTAATVHTDYAAPSGANPHGPLAHHGS